MQARQFNLVSDPWIKVITGADYHTELVSLRTLFDRADEYQQLAGDTRSQDLAVLRVLLAVLHTVYSRYDASDEPYDWLAVDSETMTVGQPVNQDEVDSDDLLETWQKLYNNGQFSAAVGQYLSLHQNDFNFFGEKPFYQVTRGLYDESVPEKKRIEHGSGTVAVKQIDRSVSESGNSRAIFSPKTDAGKDSIALPELVRWLITYQNFTGVTDKSKIESAEPFSNSSGWLYRIDPVFVKGKTLFDTLMLNLVLVPGHGYHPERPVWEYENSLTYLNDRRKGLQPDNLAELYTTWSRILCLQWENDNVPTIFSAGIPIFAPGNAFIEPMTTWRFDKKDKVYKPNNKRLESLSKAMWRNFGQYVEVQKDSPSHQPGIVAWLHQLKDSQSIRRDQLLTLATATLISDGNATSQAPAAELAEEMVVQADVLFDQEGQRYWPRRIEDAIDLATQVSSNYWHFIYTIGKVRRLSDADSKAFSGQEANRYYQRLNGPFSDWLAGLTVADDRDQKIEEWKTTLRHVVLNCASEMMQSATTRDIEGGVSEKGNPVNIFTAFGSLKYNLVAILGRNKEAIS